jgi:hypothetical protein
MDAGNALISWQSVLAALVMAWCGYNTFLELIGNYIRGIDGTQMLGKTEATGAPDTTTSPWHSTFSRVAARLRRSSEWQEILILADFRCDYRYFVA